FSNRNRRTIRSNQPTPFHGRSIHFHSSTLSVMGQPWPWGWIFCLPISRFSFTRYRWSRLTSQAHGASPFALTPVLPSHWAFFQYSNDRFSSGVAKAFFRYASTTGFL